MMDRPPQDNTMPPAWVRWFNNVWINANNESGTTADRPTKNLYVGKMYFDSTLGQPIWLKSVRPDVWVLATGVAA